MINYPAQVGKIATAQNTTQSSRVGSDETISPSEMLRGPQIASIIKRHDDGVGW